jgi:hypothetical protein
MKILYRDKAFNEGGYSWWSPATLIKETDTNFEIETWSPFRTPNTQRQVCSKEKYEFETINQNNNANKI